MSNYLPGSSCRHNVFLTAIILFALLSQAQSQEDIFVEPDGSITLCRSVGSDQKQTLIFDFVLPGSPPVKRWRQQGVLRTLWRSNSVEYTQTVLLSSLTTPDSTNSGWVLVVDVQGVNTDSEYREAFAGLTMRPAGRSPVELELRQGFVWAFDESSKSRLAALEIPESGIKVGRGEQLRFYGFMPPSINGSLTFKLPLFHFTNEATADRLQEMELQALLRHALKEPYPPEDSKIRLLFREEKKTSRRTESPPTHNPEKLRVVGTFRCGRDLSPKGPSPLLNAPPHQQY